VVHTPEGDITVLGTSFVVRISEGEVRTIVLRGSVSGAADRGLFRASANSVTAGVNQEIILNDNGAALVEIAAETIQRRLAWRDNMLAFDGETLSEAIAQVSEQTGYQFELADPALGQMRVGGYVPTPRLSSICYQTASIWKRAARVADAWFFRVALNIAPSAARVVLLDGRLRPLCGRLFRWVGRQQFADRRHWPFKSMVAENEVLVAGNAAGGWAESN
jgi:ferric-dicitrate binding protein FerR (iron transport regulator)